MSNSTSFPLENLEAARLRLRKADRATDSGERVNENAVAEIHIFTGSRRKAGRPSGRSLSGTSSRAG